MCLMLAFLRQVPQAPNVGYAYVGPSARLAGRTKAHGPPEAVSGAQFLQDSLVRRALLAALLDVRLRVLLFRAEPPSSPPRLHGTAPNQPSHSPRCLIESYLAILDMTLQLVRGFGANSFRIGMKLSE